MSNTKNNRYQDSKRGLISRILFLSDNENGEYICQANIIKDNILRARVNDATKDVVLDQLASSMQWFGYNIKNNVYLHQKYGQAIYSILQNVSSKLIDKDNWALLKQLENVDKPLATYFHTNQVFLQDLLTINKFQLQRFIKFCTKQISVEFFAVALLGVTDELKKYIVENCSTKTRAIINSQEKQSNKVKYSQIVHYQQLIIYHLLEYSSRGKIFPSLLN